MKPNIVENFLFKRPCPLPEHVGKCTEETSLSVITLEAVEKPKFFALDKKNIIFVIDVSASMHAVMPSLKASLLTFRDLMCGRENKNDVPITDEEFARCVPNFSIITFSDTAKWIWGNKKSNLDKIKDAVPTTIGEIDNYEFVETSVPTHKDNISSGIPGKSFGTVKTGFINELSFDFTIQNLDIEGSTNMGAGIELAYSICTQELQGLDARANWIVVLTDGVSNKGNYQSIDAFTKLAANKPPNTKIITLGYGTDFNAEILDVLGDFTYLPDRESISSFMGALTFEISTCSIIDVRIFFSNRRDEDPKDIVCGSKNPGWFANERKYYFGFIPKIDLPLTGEIIAIVYMEITDGEGIWGHQITERVVVSSNTNIPEHITRAIENFNAAKLIKSLYITASNNEGKLSRKIKEVLIVAETTLKDGETKETVKRICREMGGADGCRGGPPRREVFVPAADGLDCVLSLLNQTSYTNTKHLTPSSAGAAEKARIISETYL